MKVLVLNSAQIESLCDLDELRIRMAQTMADFSLRLSKNFPRFVVPLYDNGALGYMAASLSDRGPMGYKAVSVLPKNSTRELNPHQGLVSLLERETGQVYSIQDGSAITALRTAALGAAATELLAEKNAVHLGLVGNGRQAYEHARAILRVRPIERISIQGRSVEKSQLLAQRLRDHFQGPIDFASAASAEILVMATASPQPLVSTLDVQPGCHINAVGSSRPGARELELKSRSGLKIYLDSRAACRVESDEVSFALANFDIDSGDIRGELGELISDPRLGRQHTQDITVFKSVGLGIQDIAAAQYFYRRAQESGVGQVVEL
jgi:alanine dehydrogenase